METFHKVCVTCKKQFEPGYDNCPDDGGQLVPLMADPLLGTVLADKYEILRVLGSGGMSVIYQARHKYMERICAVKLLHPFLVGETDMFRRFQYEAKAASTLSHPNIVGTHDFGITNDGRAYLVMDYLVGEDLSSILEREGILTEAQAREIFRQAFMGLDHAHAKGLIHRDLKPSNLFLEPQTDGSVIVKLVDFGIAKMSGNEVGGAQNLTRTGEVFGSPLYMSPEQCAGKPLDARSDIYSLGCVMYEVLTGRTPLLGDTALETMHMHLKDKPKTISNIAPNLSVSPELESAVMRCLAKKPEERFESVGALYEAIFGQALPRSSTPISTGSQLNLPVHTSSTRMDLMNGQNGTVVTGSPGAANGHLGVNGHLSDKRPLTVRVEKKHLAIGTVAAIVLVPILSSAIWWYFLWPGPPNDTGTMYHRLLYALEQGGATEALKRGEYRKSEEMFKNAEELAKEFGDRQGRLTSVLRNELDLYTATKDNDKREIVIKRLNQITHERALADYDLALSQIRKVEKEGASPDYKQKTSKTAAKQLDAELSSLMPAVIDIGKRLAAADLIEKQESLLTEAVNTYGKYCSPDDPELATLKTELAYCHWQQDELDQVGPLLRNALTIVQMARKDKRNDVDQIDEAQQLLRLGQFDRDRSNFKEARAELEGALAIFRTYDNEAAKTQRDMEGKKCLVESLNALSDLERQENNLQRANELKEEAQKLRSKKLHDFEPSADGSK